MTQVETSFITLGCVIAGHVANWIAMRRNRSAIQEVHVSLNSRLDQLVQATGASSYAAGKADGLANPTVSAP
jgi:hypothetical protein